MTHASLRQAATIFIAFGILAVAGCSSDKRALLAPSDALMTLSAAAPFVPVNGTTTVTVEVKKSDGAPVADGTEVLVRATRGEFASSKVRTNRGTATVTYRAASEPGPVELVAESDAASGNLVLAVSSASVARVSLDVSGILPHGGGQVDLKATVFSDSGAPVIAAPVEISSSTGSLTQGTKLLTNESGQVTTKLSSPQATTARARVHVHEDSVDIAMETVVELRVADSPGTSNVGQPVMFTVTPSDLKRVGSMTLIYGDGQEQDLGQGSGVRTVSYTYSTAGGFNVTAVFKTAAGSEFRETIRHDVGGGGGGPVGGGGGSAPDDPNVPFSLSEVTWFHHDVSGWATTSQVTEATVANGEVCIYHTKAGRWPRLGGIEGNPWVFAQIGGRWYAATWEWLRPGQVCKSVTARELGKLTKSPPMETWRPQSGELIGLMVSAPARSGGQTVRERSNIVMVRWP